ncbi:MAG: hypothetical protein M1820_009306 [Bogoriella megaspora]|nr:MAG: hypothetical protein M1820_009306 [Bogoriella megaspora]
MSNGQNMYNQSFASHGSTYANGNTNINNFNIDLNVNQNFDPNFGLDLDPNFDANFDSFTFDQNVQQVTEGSSTIDPHLLQPFWSTAQTTHPAGTGLRGSNTSSQTSYPQMLNQNADSNSPGPSHLPVQPVSQSNGSVHQNLHSSQDMVPVGSTSTMNIPSASKPQQNQEGKRQLRLPPFPGRQHPTKEVTDWGWKCYKQAGEDCAAYWKAKLEEHCRQACKVKGSLQVENNTLHAQNDSLRQQLSALQAHHQSTGQSTLGIERSGSQERPVDLTEDHNRHAIQQPIHSQVAARAAAHSWERARDPNSFHSYAAARSQGKANVMLNKVMGDSAEARDQGANIYKRKRDSSDKGMPQGIEGSAAKRAKTEIVEVMDAQPSGDQGQMVASSIDRYPLNQTTTQQLCHPSDISPKPSARRGKGRQKGQPSTGDAAPAASKPPRQRAQRKPKAQKKSEWAAAEAEWAQSQPSLPPVVTSAAQAVQPVATTAHSAAATNGGMSASDRPSAATVPQQNAQPVATTASSAAAANGGMSASARPPVAKSTTPAPPARAGPQQRCRSPPKHYMTGADGKQTLLALPGMGPESEEERKDREKKEAELEAGRLEEAKKLEQEEQKAMDLENEKLFQGLFEEDEDADKDADGETDEEL